MLESVGLCLELMYAAKVYLVLVVCLGLDFPGCMYRPCVLRINLSFYNKKPLSLFLVGSPAIINRVQMHEADVSLTQHKCMLTRLLNYRFRFVAKR